jgi:hypothetical protein
VEEITADDYFEIQNLVARYFLTIDDGDAEGFMNCWVGPGDFELYASPLGRITDWHELNTLIQKITAPDGFEKNQRHFSANLSIKPVSPTKVLVAHDMMVCDVSGEPKIVAIGRYNDTVVVKTDKGWKFKSRAVK